MAKVKDCNWETIFYRHYTLCRSDFNHFDVSGQQSNRIRRKKRKIRAITPLEIIQGHRGRYELKARICDFILVIISIHILSRTVSELSQLIVQILDTLHFGATLWGFRDNVRGSSWTHWKARSGYPYSPYPLLLKTSKTLCLTT